MQSQRTDERWKTKDIYWSQNYQGIEAASVSQKKQQRNVFTSNGDSNEKLSLNLAVFKFQKQSFQLQFNFQLTLAHPCYYLKEWKAKWILEWNRGSSNFLVAKIYPVVIFNGWIKNLSISVCINRTISK